MGVIAVILVLVSFPVAIWVSSRSKHENTSNIKRIIAHCNINVTAGYGTIF